MKIYRIALPLTGIVEISAENQVLAERYAALGEGTLMATRPGAMLTPRGYTSTKARVIGVWENEDTVTALRPEEWPPIKAVVE